MLLRSFFGGLELSKICTNWPYLIIYLILYAFYLVYFLIPKLQTRYFTLIGCGALLSAILVFKLVFLFIRFLTRFAVYEKDEIDEEVRPSNISPEIWSYRNILISSQSDIDSVFNDLILSGVDPAQLLELVDSINSTNQAGGSANRSDEPVAIPDDSHKSRLSIQIGKSIHTLPFSLHQIDQINFSTPSLSCILLSVIFGFFSSYLSISLESQFSVLEKVFLSFVMASSTFSIILPPAIDPYNTIINDTWNSLARPFAITIICLSWRLILHFLCESQDSLDTCTANETVIHQLYDIKIDWNLYLPYVFIVLKYGLFFTLAMFLGFYGHPVSSFVSLFESCSRYFFGQNGFGGFLHMCVQLLRGAASVAAVWGLFQIKDPSNASKDAFPIDDSQTLACCSSFRTKILCLSIVVSTFINVFPVMLNRFLIKHWLSTFFYPFFAAAVVTITFLFVIFIDCDYDAIKWFCFSWLTLFELIFPYLYSAHQYFFCHFLVLPQIPFAPIIRYISSMIVSPLFLLYSLQITSKDHPFNDIVVAFIITHSVQKIHSETHIFALAVFFSVLSLPYDFDKKIPSANLFISLLVASRVESFLPVLRIVQNNRNYQLFTDELFELNELPVIVRYIMMKIINNAMILIDVVVKIPTLFWCFFTGGGIGPIFGCPYFLVSQPIRPNYFFDWPKNLNVYKNVYKDSKNKEDAKTPTTLFAVLFEKNVNEHPVETPVYMSAVRAVAKFLGPLIRSGRLGYVNANNIFLFLSTSDEAAFFLHVISIEPTCFRFQLRGLEYKSQTLCHESEEMNLKEIVSDYDFLSLNIHAAFHSATCDYDLRNYTVKMPMYGVSTTLLDKAFIGIDDEQCISWFIYSFAFSLRKFIYDAESNNNNDNHSSSLNQSANEFLISAVERNAPLLEMLNERFHTCHEQVNDYKFIINSKNLFNKVVDFFLTADSNGIRNNQVYNSLPFQNDSSFDISNILFNLFASVIMCVFDKNGHIIISNVSKNFNGKEFVTNEWDQDLISSLDPKIRDFVLQFVRESYFMCYLASACILDAVQNESDGLPSDETMYDVMGQLIDIDKRSVISPINSQRFASEFNLGDKKLFAIAKEKVLYFYLQDTQWSVFQVNHEYVRGMWSQESKDILFFENEDNERMSIQENIYFLNNLIIQSCDSPIGYPAYCSEIFEAYANPLLKDNLIIH